METGNGGTPMEVRTQHDDGAWRAPIVMPVTPPAAALRARGARAPREVPAAARTPASRAVTAENGEVHVHDGARTYKFLDESPTSRTRAKRLFDKEEGTIAWIESFGPDDVFYDVGANIGIYTVFAAARVRRVYAFEPHLGNAFSLLRNARLNELANVTLFASALSRCDGFFDFRYESYEIGVGNNQLDVERRMTRAKRGEPFVERKHAVTIDSLIAQGAIEPARHVKIDVDGLEHVVLEGMAELLATSAVSSLLVEHNPGNCAAIEPFLAPFGFELDGVQLTLTGKELRARGTPLEQISHNRLYRRR